MERIEKVDERKVVEGIGAKIKGVMKNRGMSYEEAGKRLGMSKQGVGYWLSLGDEKWSAKELMWWGMRLKIEWLMDMSEGKEE